MLILQLLLLKVKIWGEKWRRKIKKKVMKWLEFEHMRITKLTHKSEKGKKGKNTKKWGSKVRNSLSWSELKQFYGIIREFRWIKNCLIWRENWDFEKWNWIEFFFFWRRRNWEDEGKRKEKRWDIYGFMVGVSYVDVEGGDWIKNILRFENIVQNI